MLRIAVVDDDQIAISRLRECLNHYSEEKGVNFNIKVYQNGIDLLVGYRSDYDIIFWMWTCRISMVFRPQGGFGSLTNALYSSL